MPFTIENVNEGEMYGKWADFFNKMELDRHRTNFTLAGSYSATLDFSKGGFWSINLYRHDENDVFVASRKAHFHIKAGKGGLEVFHYDTYLISEDVESFEDRIMAGLNGKRVDYQKDTLLFKIKNSDEARSEAQARNLLYNLAVFFGEAIAPKTTS